MKTNGMGPDRMRQMVMQKFDTNRDGKLDDQEMTKFAAKLSERLGQKISPEELRARMESHRDRLAAQGDQPMLGSPRFGGMPDASMMPEELLARLDADGDGEVFQDERQAMRDQIMARLQSLQFQRR